MTLKQAIKTLSAIVLFMAVIFIALATPAYAADAGRVILSDYTQRAYTGENGLLTTSVNDVLQTEDGFLWIAGYSGLVRFDGYHFVNFAEQKPLFPSLLSVMVLFEDSENRLWIGTNDQGAMIYKANRYVVAGHDEGMSVTGFAQKSDGTVLMATKEGLYAVSPEDGSCTPVDGDSAIYTMLLDQKDRVWMIDLYGNLLVPQDVMFTADASRHYTSIYETKDGTLYLGTEAGEIFAAKSNGDGYDKVRLIKTGMIAAVKDFCEDLQGNLWVVLDVGLGRIENDSFLMVSGTKISSALEKINVDYEGNIWVASQRGGLLQLMPSIIRDYSFAANLGEPVVNAAMYFDGLTYIGTDEGLVVINDSFEKVKNELTDLLDGIRIRSITKAANGDIWIAAYSQYGAVRYAKDGSITIFNKASGVISDRARQVLVLKSGDMAVATGEGLSIIGKDGTIASYGTKEGLKNAVILCVAEGKDGKLYLGTDGDGIYILENGIIAPFGEEELAKKAILRIAYDETRDNLWIAGGTGFYYYDGTLKSLEHVVNAITTVFDILFFPDGRVCLLGRHGFVCGTAESILENKSDLTIILQKGGLPFQITANSFSSVNEAGDFFLCGSKDVGRMNSEALKNNTSEPRLVIDSVSIDNDIYDAKDELIMPSNAKRLTFDVVSPHFGYAEALAFEYYLEGFDSAPSVLHTGKEQVITYTNLPGGEYKFHIRVKNGAGEYGNERVLTIKKTLHFFEHKIVWVGIAVLGLILVFIVTRLVIFLRMREALRKQEMYRRMTSQTIHTISNAIDAKDKYTEGHSERVAKYSLEIGRRMGLPEDELEKLYYIALLHDIGKIGITDTILNKPERLDDDEFAIMKTHTTIGGEILKDFDSLPDISEGARAHHEKFDGTGYPNGLKGDEISLIARIIGVCDTYDAMATTRAYRKGLDKEIIIKEIERCMGTQFDPAIAPIMIEMIKEGVTS